MESLVSSIRDRGQQTPIEVVHRETKWVTGLDRVKDKSSGNPSPYTARGCMVGMRAVMEELTGSPTLARSMAATFFSTRSPAG